MCDKQIKTTCKSNNNHKQNIMLNAECVTDIYSHSHSLIPYFSNEYNKWVHKWADEFEIIVNSKNRLLL